MRLFSCPLLTSEVTEYEKVYDMAKDNYESNRNNPFHIQAYFDCLIRMPDFDGRRDILKELIQNLDRVDTDVAKEMTIRSKAQYAGFVDNDKKVSLDLLDEAVSVSSNSFYPKSAKFDICEKFRDIEGMKSALDDLEKSIDKDSYHYMGVLKKKCIYKAYTEGSDSAIKFLQSRLINYPTRTKDELIQKIIRIGELTS